MIRMCANLYLAFILGRSFDRINLRKEKRGALKRLLHRICISNKDSQCCNVLFIYHRAGAIGRRWKNVYHNLQ